MQIEFKGHGYAESFLEYSTEHMYIRHGRYSGDLLNMCIRLGAVPAVDKTIRNILC